MVGLTDQFPVSLSHPAVIRSSCTWRERWIPLGFISSNYSRIPPHSVFSLPILYFSSRHWTFLLFLHSLDSSPHFLALWIILSPFVSWALSWIFWPQTAEHVKSHIQAERSQEFTFEHTRTHIPLLFSKKRRIKRPFHILSNRAKGCISLLPFFYLFFSHACFFFQLAQRWDGQLWALSDSVSHESRKEHEDYRKGKILLRAAFYSQFVFICPPAPLGCLWERVSTCFIGRYCVSRSKSVFTHRCERRTSVSVPLLFVSGWNYLGVNGLLCPSELVQDFVWIKGVCIFLKVRAVSLVVLVCT